jgi:hypothetical protein
LTRDLICPAKRLLTLRACSSITVQRESDHESFNALFTTDDGKSCRIRAGTLRSHHRWEATWRGIINGDGETNASITKINPESPTNSAHSAAPVAGTPRAAASRTYEGNDARAHALTKLIREFLELLNVLNINTGNEDSVASRCARRPCDQRGRINALRATLTCPALRALQLRLKLGDLLKEQLLILKPKKVGRPLNALHSCAQILVGHWAAQGFNAT